MALFVECEGLSDKELEVRHNLIYLFNPCLKFIFNQRPEFRQYAYNSCRQTAIFSAAFLMNALPAKCTVYEGKFSDVIHGEKVTYDHAFTIAEDGENRLLIDVSRTQRKLLFQPLEGFIYPKVEGYMDLELLEYKELDFYNLLLTEAPEYLSGKKPVETMEWAVKLYNNLKNKPKSEQIVFASDIYNKTTEIGGEFF